MKKINIKIDLMDGRTMNAELYQELAPLSVKNIVKLIKEDFYAGLIFHRVIPGFMIQGGGMNFEMQEKQSPFGQIKGEFSINGWKKNLKLSHTKGVLSMARTSVMDSATSQFFIVTDESKFLDGQYASFGKLTDDDSIKVALDIEKVSTTTVGYHGDVPEEPIIIKTITVV